MSRPVLHMTSTVLVCTSVGMVSVLGTAAAIAQEVRSAAAHQHGTIEVEIAVDGNEIAMALYAPGADIVGFEHPPTSDADKQAVAGARETLMNPSALLGLPDAAGCTVEHASVSASSETAEHGHAQDEHHEHEHEEHGEHDHDKDHEAAHSHDHEGQDHGETHLEFVAEYHFDCANIGAANALALGIFEVFPSAEKLSFTILGEGGASAATVKRGQTSLMIDFGN